MRVRLHTGEGRPLTARSLAGREPLVRTDGSTKPPRAVSLASVRHAFRTIIWPRRKLVFLGLLLIGINRLSGLVLPGSTKYLIDNVIVDRDLQLLKLLLLIVGAGRPFLVKHSSLCHLCLASSLLRAARRLAAVLHRRLQPATRRHLPPRRTRKEDSIESSSPLLRG